MDAIAGQTKSQPTQDLASRTFENKLFQLIWAVSLMAVVTFVSFPIQRVLLVWLVYGRQAYSKHLVYVVPRKPLRFSDGVLVPQHLDILTGAGMFVVTVFGLTLALFFGLRLYERFFGNLRTKTQQ